MSTPSEKKGGDRGVGGGRGHDVRERVQGTRRSASRRRCWRTWRCPHGMPSPSPGAGRGRASRLPGRQLRPESARRGVRTSSRTDPVTVPAFDAVGPVGVERLGELDLERVGVERPDRIAAQQHVSRWRWTTNEPWPGKCHVAVGRTWPAAPSSTTWPRSVLIKWAATVDYRVAMCQAELCHATSGPLGDSARLRPGRWPLPVDRPGQPVSQARVAEQLVDPPDWPSSVMEPRTESQKATGSRPSSRVRRGPCARWYACGSRSTG